MKFGGNSCTYIRMSKTSKRGVQGAGCGHECERVRGRVRAGGRARQITFTTPYVQTPEVTFPIPVWIP